MTTEEREEIKEIIKACNTGINARVEAKYDIIDVKLDGINNHLETLNGTVVMHEKILQKNLLEYTRDKQKNKDNVENRNNTCPKIDEINKLKQDNITHYQLKKNNARLFTISTVVLALIFTAIGIWIKTGI